MRVDSHKGNIVHIAVAASCCFLAIILILLIDINNAGVAESSDTVLKVSQVTSDTLVIEGTVLESLDVVSAIDNTQDSSSSINVRVRLSHWWPNASSHFKYNLLLTSSTKSVLYGNQRTLIWNASQ
jgi:hypothetical protein